MSINIGVTMSSVIEGITVNHQLKCSKCGSEKVVLVFVEGHLQVRCSICWEDVIYPDYYKSVSVRDRLRELVKKEEMELIPREDSKSDNGNGKKSGAEVKIVHIRLCKKCHKNEVKGKKWYCNDCRKILFPEKVIKYCPNCEKNKINRNQKICSKCKREIRVSQIRCCPQCSTNRLIGRQKICTTCKGLPSNHPEAHLRLSCGKIEFTGKTKICDSCKEKTQKNKTHLCLRCKTSGLIGKAKVCDICKKEPKKKKRKIMIKKTKVRICPRCEVTSLERYEHYCKGCKK